MTTPTYFADAPAFRRWLVAHSETARELLVGFHKVATGQPSMTWPQSVDEALCFGWIDGVRKRIDDNAYTIRFTPRKPSSVWSAINIAKFEKLQAEGRMTAEGEKAYAHRKSEKSRIYAYEQAETAELSAQEVRTFKRNKTAWAYWDTAPPGYRKVLLHWVTTAKKTETRVSRLNTLIEACAIGKRLR